MTGGPGAGLTRFARFVAETAWRGHLREVMAEHFGPAAGALGLRFEEFDDVLDGNWTRTLWHCALEDFATRRYRQAGETPVQAYLADRHCRESSSASAYLLALQHSAMRLYAIGDTAPGQSVWARDVISGGAPALVRTQTMIADASGQIAARLVALPGAPMMACGALPFTSAAVQRLCIGPGDGAGGAPAAALFSRAWLSDRLGCLA